MQFSHLLIALSILLLVLVYGLREEPGTYHGTEIYVLALELKEASNQTLLIEGEYVRNGTPVIVTGRLVNIGKGKLDIDTGETILSIGGPLAGKEDIAASKITLK